MSLLLSVLIFILGFGITLGLGIASYQDIKTREIEDKTWLLMLLFLLPVFIYYAANTFTIIEWLYWGLNVFFGIFTAFMLFYSGAWGGADSKALMVLSILWPFQTLFNPEITLGPFPIIGLLTNMIIFMIATVFWFIISNVYFKLKNYALFNSLQASFLMKFIALISCTPVPLDQIPTTKFSLPAETIQNNQRILKPGFFALLDDEKTEQEILLEYYQQVQSILNNSQPTEDIKHLQTLYKTFPYIWVRPMPPGILFLFLGWIWYLMFLSPINLFLASLIS